MKYFFSRYKFTSQLFYKKIDKATVKVFTDCFQVQVLPFYTYSGNYFKHSIFFQDNNKTIYRTIYVDSKTIEIDLENINLYNEYFVGIYSSGKKVTIFKSSLDGIIFKV